MKENYPIDFVLTWVDGDDPAWQEEFRKYYRAEKGFDVSLARTRDWGNLHYWFRAIEKFAPWLRTVHLVTWGHLPSWLNKSAPKLHIVSHKDFIPPEYLPTFHSETIACNLWRIEGLSEHFVHFDDDMFIGRKVNRTRFFKKGVPCDFAQLTPLIPINPFGHYILNALEMTHRRHNVRKAILRNPNLWFNPKYGLKPVCKTLSLLPWSRLVGFKNPHVPLTGLRSEYEKMWREEFTAFDATCKSRFRSHADTMNWLTRYERLATGNFTPIGIGDTKNDVISDANATDIARYIAAQRYRLFCINDSNNIADFEKAKNTINAAFEEILPGKSSFELS
jgi:hypothetical protein